MLFALDLAQHSVLFVVVVGAFLLDLLHEGAADHAGWFFGDEEEHVRRLVHVLNLAHVYRLLQIRQRQRLPQNVLLLLFVELALLHSRESVNFGEVVDPLGLLRPISTVARALHLFILGAFLFFRNSPHLGTDSTRD